MAPLAAASESAADSSVAKMNGLTSGLSKLFSRKNDRHTPPAEIGFPTDVRQHVHVSKNVETGDLEGLPPAWRRLVDAHLTAADRHDHPDAAYQAVKFYNYSIKKKEAIEPFKPLLTEEAFSEESRRIDQLLDDKNDDRSSEEDKERLPPPKPLRRSAPPAPLLNFDGPPQLDKAPALCDLSRIDEDGEDSPVLRRKEKHNASLTDEQIYQELHRICNPENPHLRFERIRDVGTGASGE